MVKYQTNELELKFKQLGINEGDNILIHNALINFGIPSDIQLSKLSELIFLKLKSIIGINGTIAVPTFNFDFCKGIAFDKSKTPSKSMGVFSEYIRIQPDAKRSSHPMQSVAVLGKNAEFLIQNDTVSSFLKNGIFDKMIDLDFKILLLGADFNTNSFIHYIEEKLEVPYRYWKDFEGEYVDNQAISIKKYKLFVRSLESNPLLKLYAIEDELKIRNQITEVELGSGKLKCFSAKNFISIAEEKISKNPYYFVSNHPNFNVNEKTN